MPPALDFRQPLAGNPAAPIAPSALERPSISEGQTAGMRAQVRTLPIHVVPSPTSSRHRCSVQGP